METLNDKFCKVTGLTWDLNQYIASLKTKGMSDEQISEKILWLVPDGAMIELEGRRQSLTKELLSDETLAELGIDENAKFGPDEESEEDEHEYVDLGLPSGTMWAKYNIQDADGNELYFAWGETSGYTAGQVGVDKYFNWQGNKADYAFGPVNYSDTTNWGMKKYNNIDELTALKPEDDAATVNWGENWRIPTKEQFDELKANTSYEWTEVNGVQGAKLTSNVDGYTDRFLFFPALGQAAEGNVSYVGEYGLCWLVAVYGQNIRYALYHQFKGGYSDSNYIERFYGLSVRPVRSK